MPFPPSVESKGQTWSEPQGDRRGPDTVSVEEDVRVGRAVPDRKGRDYHRAKSPRH